MPLTKAAGNMYPWVTHTHTHIGGACPHMCAYCYVQAMARRFGHGRYKGELRLIEEEFNVSYGSGKTIFVEHCNDLFAAAVPDAFIRRVLEHCREHPWNKYVFQTKNPARMLTWIQETPQGSLFGCTAETNRHVESHAPQVIERLRAMHELSCMGERTFITVEPILACDGEIFALGLSLAKPEFVNIGADSKGHGLVEPASDEITVLLEDLQKYGVEIRQKRNLERLLAK